MREIWVLEEKNKISFNLCLFDSSVGLCFKVGIKDL